MNTTTSTSSRIATIDILRGIAIFGMILCANIGWESGLPAWMFHAQVPPPDYVFRPDVPGITWVDLVFPFFLFSMGAAFPFALDKRIRSGQPAGKTVLGLVKRWAILVAFSIVLGNGYAARSSEVNRYVIYGFQLLLWGAMFLSLTRFNFRKERLSTLVNISGVALTAVLAVIQHTVLDVPFSKGRSDIIIMVLAYVALTGGLIWLATRKSVIYRWMVFIGIGIIKGITAYAPGVFAFLPDVDSLGIGWIFRWEFLQYLMIALAGSVVGDMILARRNECLPAGDQCGNMDRPDISRKDTWLANLVILTVCFQLWGLFTRHVTADFAVSAVSALLFITMTYRKRNLWSDIAAIGYILLLAGIVFDPIDGGITKDHCNLSYLFTTAGMAAMTTGFLIFMETCYGMKARLLSECGQNPMIAYTVTNFITSPVLYGAGLLGLIDSWAIGSPFMGIVRGLFVTGIMMAITVFFTRKRIFWRS